MKSLPNQTFFPFLCWLTLAAAAALAQPPALAPSVPFTLPLTDGTMAQAQFLPTQNGEGWIAYATNSGKLATYYLTPTRPGPQPDPIPPVPPQPTRLTIAIVENPAATTQPLRAVLASPEWREEAAAKHNFLGIIPNDVIDKKTGQPPPRLAPFLDRAKTHDLPWVMFTNAQNVILWEGQLPSSATELKNLIKKYGG